jgi:S-adenosylmethionine:tRNA ribosyltransferase-isomerase
MRLEDLDYHLPVELIAQRPVEPRDSARLLIDHGSASPSDAHVFDLPGFLQPGDALVVNHTRVFPARLRLARQSGGAIEVLLLEDHGSVWTALIRGGAKLRPEEELYASDGTAVVRFRGRTDEVFEVELLDERWPLEHGEMPLPPYITERLEDGERYQTVYSHDARSSAAPTAGLHLTEKLMAEIRAKGVQILEVELVVGLDTFKPIDVVDPLQHRMHTEYYRVPSATWEACRTVHDSGGSVVAVGTTATRALESAASTGQLSGRTSLYITPGFEWRVVDKMMTNFHMPRTTLIMMIYSMIGERWRKLYDHAIEQRYRMLSFGDAMLLDRHAR